MKCYRDTIVFTVQLLEYVSLVLEYYQHNHAVVGYHVIHQLKCYRPGYHLNHQDACHSLYHAHHYSHYSHHHYKTAVGTAAVHLIIVVGHHHDSHGGGGCNVLVLVEGGVKLLRAELVLSCLELFRSSSKSSSQPLLSSTS